MWQMLLSHFPHEKPSRQRCWVTNPYSFQSRLCAALSPTHCSFYLKNLFPFLSLTQFTLLLQITASWTSSCPWNEGWRPYWGSPNALCSPVPALTTLTVIACLIVCLLCSTVTDSRKWMHLVSLLIDHQHLICTQKCSLHVDMGSGWMDEWLYRWMDELNR